MRARRWISVLTVLLALAGAPGLDAQGQGKGGGGEKKAPQGQGQTQGRKPDARPSKAGQQGPGKAQPAARPKQSGEARSGGRAQGGSRAQAEGRQQPGRGPDKSVGARGAAERPSTESRGRGRGFERTVAISELRPEVRRYAASRRAPERMAAGAVARAFARGVDDDAFTITPSADRVHIRNRSGDLLLDLDDRRARSLGSWDVRPVGYSGRTDGPSFCRSGAGHPVWGREWCIDKGWGIGQDRDIWWGRSTSLSDIIFARRVDSGRLARDMLIATLGNVVLDRLGLHAITLGFADPLTGVWIGEPSGPQVLQVYSGSYPVAEFVDNDRDDRADVMLVALRPW